MPTQRSRRLRKKMRVGEFQEMGFNFSIELDQVLDDGSAESLIDAFIAELLVPRDLEFGGWVSGGFICRAGRGSATEDDRQAVQAWWQERPQVRAVVVGELIDAWH